MCLSDDFNVNSRTVAPNCSCMFVIMTVILGRKELEVLLTGHQDSTTALHHDVEPVAYVHDTSKGVASTLHKL